MDSDSAMVYLTQDWVTANCAINMGVVVLFYIIHHYLSNHSKSFYGRAASLDKLTVLMNLNFAIVYSIVLVPFSVAAARVIMLDTNQETVNHSLAINFGFNALATLFLIEGVLVASIRPNQLLFYHHLIFYIFVLLFTLTKSTLILRIGLVLGCLTTWQIFPRITATLRHLGVRRRHQKIVALVAVVLGFITRIILGPLGLIKVSLDGYQEMLPTLTSRAIYFGSLTTVFCLLYIEFEGVARHVKLHRKLKELAAQSLLNLKNGTRSLLQSMRKVSVQHQTGKKDEGNSQPAATAAGGTTSRASAQNTGSLRALRRQSSKLMSAVSKSIVDTALHGGEEYLKYLEETAIDTNTAAESNGANVTATGGPESTIKHVKSVD